MKIPGLLFVIIAVVVFLALRRKPTAGAGTIASPPGRTPTLAQMIERYAAVAGQDEALAMLEKLELDPNAPAGIVNAMRHAPGMSRALETATEGRAPTAAAPPKKQKQQAANRPAKHRAQPPAIYGLRDEIGPLGALPHLPPLRHMRPLPKLAALSALPPVEPLQAFAARPARS